MFSKLFEILPDAEQLLNLEPEQLAGPLLVSLEDKVSIAIDEIISDSEMRRTPKPTYPARRSIEILLALTEAWQWLEHEGLVAPQPADLQGDIIFAGKARYFVTRRGKRIQTPEALESYRKANLLPKAQLHPVIAQKVWSIFLQGDYDTAVFQAFKQVEVAVRKAGGYEENDRGTDLMRKAFHVNNGNLTDKSRLPAVKQAMSDLSAGAIGLYKNPSSHHEVEFSPEEAAEIIIIASHLLRTVDTCAERTSNAST